MCEEIKNTNEVLLEDSSVLDTECEEVQMQENDSFSVQADSAESTCAEAVCEELEAEILEENSTKTDDKAPAIDVEKIAEVAQSAGRLAAGVVSSAVEVGVKASELAIDGAKKALDATKEAKDKIDAFAEEKAFKEKFENGTHAAKESIGKVLEKTELDNKVVAFVKDTGAAVGTVVGSFVKGFNEDKHPVVADDVIDISAQTNTVEESVDVDDLEADAVQSADSSIQYVLVNTDTISEETQGQV